MWAVGSAAAAVGAPTTPPKNATLNHAPYALPRRGARPDAPLRIGIADLISTKPDSLTRRIFAAGVQAAAARLGLAVDVVGFGVNLDETPRIWDLDWDFDGLIVSGSEPRSSSIGSEPILAFVERVLGECAATSTMFSCQSSHAALHLLHGLSRRRLPVRRHGTFEHDVHPSGVLATGMSGAVRVPHSRWNTVPRDELSDAEVSIVLDCPDNEWQLATSRDGLKYVFVQGHPEYLPDTMAREYRRELRRWIADDTRAFPGIPMRYFRAEAQQQLVEHAERIRVQRDPALLGEIPLAAGYADVEADWSADSNRFFTNWLAAIRG